MNETKAEIKKFEFCSEEWVAVARDYLKDAVEGSDLGSASFSFGEIFTDPPAHLLESGDTEIGWHMILTNGELIVNKGVLADADMRITADYTLILPLAQTAFKDNPEGMANAQKVMATAAASGKMKREGDDKAFANLPPALGAAFAGLHDFLALRTL